MTQSIFNYIENNKKLQALIRRSVTSDLYDDFKSDLYLNLLEIKNDKLNIAWMNDGYKGGNNTDWLVARLVMNGRGYKSHFYRTFRKRKFIEIENEMFDVKYNPTMKEAKEYEELLVQVELILTELPYMDKFFFIKHYFDGIKMKQLSRETGYNYSTVRINVKKTFEYLKKRLEEYDEYNFDDLDINFED